MPRRGGVCLVFALRSFCVRGRATDRQRISDGRAFVGCRQFEAFRDGRRRAVGGLATGLRRTGGTRTHTGFVRTAHGLAYGLLTDGRRAGIGQTWTNPAISRWAAARRADFRRAYHGRFPYGRTTGGRRTGNGHQTGGGRAGIRLLPTFCAIPRWAAARRTWDGLLTGGRRTAGAGRRPRTFDGRRIA